MYTTGHLAGSDGVPQIDVFNPDFPGLRKLYFSKNQMDNRAAESSLTGRGSVQDELLAFRTQPAGDLSPDPMSPAIGAEPGFLLR